MPAPTRLLVEHLVAPRGLGVAAPRLSWWLPDGTARQEAFALRVDEWESGRIEGTQHVGVPWPGPEVGSGQGVTWQVKVWTDAGESDWSDPSTWEAGLLHPTDWSASWISPTEGEVAPAGERPAQLLRATFDLPEGVAVTRARAYATAHGLYELFVNDRRVGDIELAPGSTAYRANLDVQTYDLTDLVRPGANAVGAVLSDGWFRGQNGFTREHDCFGARLALLAQVVVDLADGERVVVGTGPGWRSSTGEIVRADLIEGEAVDLRLRQEGWSTASFAGADAWAPCTVRDDLGLDTLTSSPAPPVRRTEELRPVSVTRVGDGVEGVDVVDLGQNINGWVRLSSLGPAGATTTLTHGEMLDEAGRVTLDHLVPFDFMKQEALSPGQVDQVVSRGEPGDTFEPRHTTHGFQYIQVEGHEAPLDAEDVTGVVVHTDLVRTGWFSCSDDRLERLHEAAIWSFRDNACDVPTDCPQRERAPWTGDWQIFAPTAAYLYDVAGFSAKWLRDLRADQWPDGRVPNFTPDPAGPAAFDHELARFMTGSSGWGDAAVLVPWEMWVEYGDERFLTEQFDSMVAWVDFAATTAANDRHPIRAANRPEPAAHETYLWDTGFHWGEWCEPDSDPATVFTREADLADVATAYLHLSARRLGQIAGLLERHEEAARYRELAERSLEAWRAEFIDDDGRITPDTQPNLVRALAFDLVPDDLRAVTADRLVELVHTAGDHLTTGFLATPYLLPVLADHGHLDLAYRLLFQDTPPSWLAMIDRGATTIWEHWEGVDAQGDGSLNHYSKGAVVTFLHRYVAGLRPDPDHPAYERFTVAPMPGGGLTAAEAVHDSRRGRARSGWKIESGRFLLEVEVPPGANAEVILPDGRRHEQGPGIAAYSCAVGDVLPGRAVI